MSRPLHPHLHNDDRTYLKLFTTNLKKGFSQKPNEIFMIPEVHLRRLQKFKYTERVQLLQPPCRSTTIKVLYIKKTECVNGSAETGKTYLRN